MKQVFMSFIVLLNVMGCSEEQISADLQIVSFGEEFELAVNETVVVVDNFPEGEVDSLLVKVTSIQDNRCPEDAQCIRAGEVQAEVSVASRQRSQEVATCLGYGCGFLDEKFRNDSTYTEIDTTRFTLNNRSYHLIFTNAIPFPNVENIHDTDSKQIVLSVQRQ